MVQRTENNYLLPQSDDGPSVLIDLLRQNLRRLAKHSHDGVDSEPFNQRNFANFVQTVNPVWGTRDASTGLFTASVEVEDGSGILLSNRTPAFYLPSGEHLYLDYKVESNGEMSVRSNEAFASLLIYYG